MLNSRLLYLNIFLTTIGRLAGYRRMWEILRNKHNLVCSRESVRLLLSELSPEDVESRRAHRLKRRTYKCRGPNPIWHADGYDKLRPYGFLISGCIDGFSRRLIWFTCAYTNRNPAVIADYYLEAITKLNGNTLLYLKTSIITMKYLKSTLY